MRRVAAVALGAVMAFVLWGLLDAHGFIHFFGIDTQQSDNYDFWSGVGPCLVTAIGLSSLVGGLWHAHNCHADGCWNIGRHKVNGTPWCNAHLELAQSQVSLEQRLGALIGLLEARERRLASASALYEPQAHPPRE